VPASPLTGGKRRIDRVLAADFVDGLPTLTLVELRARRQEADQEEVDLSYVRRLLQGRLDILGAELARRAEGDPTSAAVVDSLAQVLSEDDRAPARGLGRHRTVEPSRIGDTRRSEESLAADPAFDEPASLSDSELHDAARLLRTEEQAVSSQRVQVQAVLDVLSGEMTERYRSGSASVDALLPGPS